MPQSKPDFFRKATMDDDDAIAFLLAQQRARKGLQPLNSPYVQAIQEAAQKPVKRS